jgi:hypothetical protein
LRGGIAVLVAGALDQRERAVLHRFVAAGNGAVSHSAAQQHVRRCGVGRCASPQRRTT